MPFTFKRLEIEELILVEPRVFADERGFFMETYKTSDFQKAGIDVQFTQSNHSRSRRGVLRGLHYQCPPSAQGKLVSVIQGRVFDVAADIRQGSPTYGQWVGVELSEENHRLLYVPPGFAHGFCVLSEVADFIYHVTAEYAPDCERGIIWNDPDLAIAWPIADPQVSKKDAALPCLQKAECDFRYRSRTWQDCGPG